MAENEVEIVAPRPTVQPALPALEGEVDATFFDGWDFESKSAWLVDKAPLLAGAERITHEYRLAVGLGLYELLRDQGEGVATRTALAMANAAGVSVKTITRWRTTAQDHLRLPAPSPRAAAQRARQAARPQVIDAASTNGDAALTRPPGPDNTRAPADESKRAEHPWPCPLYYYSAWDGSRPRMACSCDRPAEFTPPPVQPALDDPVPRITCPRCNGEGTVEATGLS